jgi:hypothetical protein
MAIHLCVFTALLRIPLIVATLQHTGLIAQHRRIDPVHRYR